MVVRADSRGEFHAVDRWPGGVGWMAHPDETMRRTSHALATDAGVYLVDPVDCADLDERLSTQGAVAGVIVLSSFHARDAGPVAARHDVPVLVPAWIDRVLGRLGDAAGVERDAVAVERVGAGDRLPGSDYRLRTVADDPIAAEGALWDPDGGTLVVTESLGTAPHFLAGDERLGVTAFRRLIPPRAAFAGLDPDRVLVGHGEGVFEDAAAALTDALRGARRRAPALFGRNLPALARTAWTALRH